MPTTTTWRILIDCLEKLRKLNTGGFRMDGVGTWLIGVDWNGSRHGSGPSTTGFTACSPCGTQAIVMAFAEAADRDGFDPDRYLTDQDYRSATRFRTHLPLAFVQAANGRLDSDPQSPARRQAAAAGFAVDMSANGWPESIAAFGLGELKPNREMRRGDIVHIDWPGPRPTPEHPNPPPHGGGHAVFAYDVHFDRAGNADAVLVMGANGHATADRHGFYGPGISVYGNPPSTQPLVARSGRAGHETYAAPSPYFDDAYAETFVTQGTWVKWGAAPIDFTNTRYPHMGPTVTQALAVHIARLNGLEAPAGLCMDAPEHGDQPPAPPPAVHVESAAPAEVDRSALDASQPTVATQTRATATQAADAPTPGQRRIESRLATLHRHGWLRADPGAPDGINDAQTQAALREFQQRHMAGHPAHGRADRATRTALHDAADRARHDAPPPDAPPAAPPAPATPTLARVYWSTPSTGPSGTVQLFARGTGLAGRTLTVAFETAADHAALGTQVTIEVATVDHGEDIGSVSVPVAPLVHSIPHATTVLVDARVSGDGVAEMRTGAPLRVESGELILPPRDGKGLFSTGYIAGDLPALARALREAGLTWIILGALPGGPHEAEAREMNPVSHESLQRSAAAFRAEGIEVWIWGWVFPCRARTGQDDPAVPLPDPPTGAALTDLIHRSVNKIVKAATAIQARGVVLDIEGGFARTGADGARQLAALAGELTTRGTTLGLGLSSFKSTGLALHAMQAAGGFAMPQLYGFEVDDASATHHHEGHDTIAAASWFANAGWTKLVPTVPVWAQHPYDVTPDRLATLMQYLRDHAGASDLVSWSAWALMRIVDAHHQLGGSNEALGRRFLSFT